VRVVAKFGGTSLGSGDRIERAADSVADAVAAGHEIAVVASAMGSQTDDLLEEISFDASDEDRAEIVSMGERTSVRMLKAALASRDVDATFLEPGSEDWPVVTNERGEIDAEETQRRVDALAAKLGDTVPVITGFLAEDPAGNVTTLGRGGSDTTAMMLGKYMDADEVVIVTDVEGVMTGDPRVVEGARNVGSITVDELRNLSFRGAEVVAPSALVYKDEELGVRVVHYQHGNLLSGGTSVEGSFEHLIDMEEAPLSCSVTVEDDIAVIRVTGGELPNQPGVIRSLVDPLADAGINVHDLITSATSVAIFVAWDDREETLDIVHEQF